MPSLISHTITAGGANGGTTPAINTVGASLIVIASAYFAAGNGPVFTDSLGNQYIAQFDRGDLAANGGEIIIATCVSPITGPAHTFSVAGLGIKSGLVVAAFNGTSGVLDVGISGGNASASSINAGVITPTNNNALIVTTCELAALSAAFLSVDSGFVITDSVANSSTNYGLGLAYLVQSAKTGVNPTWTANAAGGIATLVASFLSGSGALLGGGIQRILGD